jgi:hypothetical protein
MTFLNFQAMYGACPYPDKKQAEAILYDPKDLPQNPVRVISGNNESELIINPEPMKDDVKIEEIK